MIKLKLADASDAVLIARTRHLVWLQTYRGIYPDTKLDEYDLAMYTIHDQQKLSDNNNHYYLFMDGEDCVGYFSFGPYHYGQYKNFQLCLNHLYLLNNYQGRELGRLAFQIITDYCRQNELKKFFCGCNVNNLPAIRFYRHMGGVQGSEADYHLPKEDQIVHFEFYLGE